MSTHDVNIQSIKESIEKLIVAGTTFDLDALENIYHDDLRVTMIDEEGNVNNSDKLAFKRLFETKKKQGSAPLNTWSKLHQVEANNSNAHVLISRKINLIDQEQDLTLSIDLIKVEEDWRVIREVIFVQPVTSHELST